jgi:hypothetical protein
MMMLKKPQDYRDFQLIILKAGRSTSGKVRREEGEVRREQVTGNR